MRIYWAHAPYEGGQIWCFADLCPRQQHLSDEPPERKCKCCGQRLPYDLWERRRVRWLNHSKKYSRFLPCWIYLPPEDKPWTDPERLTKFLRRVLKLLVKRPGVRLTPTGQPRGFIWAFWCFEAVPAGHERLPEGRYLKISLWYIPDSPLTRSDWASNRKETPKDFPREVITG